jgi:hypothetical protein
MGASVFDIRKMCSDLQEGRSNRIVIPFLALARRYLSSSPTAPIRGASLPALSVSVEEGLGRSGWTDGESKCGREQWLRAARQGADV